MSAFNIETYLESKIDSTEIDIQSENISELPSLINFKNLRVLNCSNNNLTSLPELPENLQELHCRNNKLTSLPELPENLRHLQCQFNKLTSLPRLPETLDVLCCDFNELTSLPRLPENLELFSCERNQLTSLPRLPENLKVLNCLNNKIVYLPDLPLELQSVCCLYNPLRNIIELYNLQELKAQIIVLNRVRHLIHSLKCKKQLRKWLWMKVRLPKIQDKYHPDNLKELLDTINDDDEDGFNTAIDTW